uniref:Metastasis associated 1 family member 3 n=1 Tax=Pipistrellus kuhlii TaxID=59472 RepID=A0A7J7VVU6_PIPKU|nr:metastasis associated 1 family member 3 [Pipistrellus kuhlii]
MGWANSHAACQTELPPFHPVIQDWLRCPADVQAVPGKEAALSPAPHGDSMRGEGEGTGGVHVQNAESPRVNQCHLAFLRDLAVPRETCLSITGKREPLRLLPAHTLHPAQQLWGQGGG